MFSRSCLICPKRPCCFCNIIILVPAIALIRQTSCKSHINICGFFTCSTKIRRYHSANNPQQKSLENPLMNSHCIKLLASTRERTPVVTITFEIDLPSRGQHWLRQKLSASVRSYLRSSAIRSDLTKVQVAISQIMGTLPELSIPT